MARRNSRRTTNQLLGDLGEITVTRNCYCPKCKRHGTLRRLRANFKAADVICDFCGFVAQVKAVTVQGRKELPKHLLGASWRVQRDRMESHIYLPLFVVTIRGSVADQALYVPADLQVPSMFKPRNPLRETARRAGWQGFMYDLSVLPPGIPVIVWENPRPKAATRTSVQQTQLLNPKT
jgi:type II restriction enzyme